MRLIGLVLTRCHLTLDYMPVEAACSLSPTCDEVVIVDMESDDGSWEELNQQFAGQACFTLKQQPWDKPHNDPGWWVRALNRARESLDQHAWLLQLDADEILGPESFDGVHLALDSGTPGLFRRFTFWRDPCHLVPYNRCCGEMVARLGPTNLYLPSDEPTPARHPNIRDYAEAFSGLHIYHYGMIRDPQAFVRKSKVVQNCFFGSVDQRIETAQKENAKWHDADFFDGLPLRDFVGKHPNIVRKWLLERGHSL